ncbi:MAG: hypothetical protein GY797_12365 [Deltaproteobacteria bacterium]|nr:hypothetical protein [Deltaproteobacteria bacterium]
MEYHGSFSAKDETDESLPYSELRRKFKGFDDGLRVDPFGLYDGYTESSPSSHVVERVTIETQDYVGKGFTPVTPVVETDVTVHETELIDFGLFEECRKKALERGILPAPSAGSSSELRRWDLSPVEQQVISERFEIHARKPEGGFLTFADIYDLSSSSEATNGVFWLPHFDGAGLYYPIKFAENEPHRRPLDSLQYLRKASVQLHSYGSNELFLSGCISVDSASGSTALKKLVFGNIPIAEVPHEGDGYYRGPTLNINRFNVAPRKKVQLPDPAFVPMATDRPLYAFLTGGDTGDKLIENTSFGVEQLHLQFRRNLLHL